MRLFAVIDKVEVRVPAHTQFSPVFASLYRDLSSDPKVNVFHPSLHYTRVGDLRPHGYQAVLHLGCTHGREGNHKLELVDTGEMSYVNMQSEIQRIFDADPWHLGVMRIDLAADVPHVPVGWFSRHLRVKWKQWACDIGQIEYAQMGRRGVQTLYFGKRPNCIRVYDKIAELLYQYTRLRRRAPAGTEFPSFEDTYGYPESGYVLTRVERQIAGGRVPAEINMVGKLRSLPHFNPFDKLEFIDRSSTTPEPNIEDYPVLEFCAGVGLRHLADDLGMHRLRAVLNKHSRGNGSRIIKKYGAFLPREDTSIDEHKLRELYLESIGRQLAA